MFTINENYLKLPGSYLFQILQKRLMRIKVKIRKQKFFALESEM